MQAVSIRTKSAEFGNDTIPTKSAKGIAATLAVNVDPRRRRRAHLRQHGQREQRHRAGADRPRARSTRPPRPAAIATTAEDAISFKLGLANGDLGVAASLALNFIGWDVGTTAIDTTLAAVDALLGTELRRDRDAVGRPGATSGTRR